MRNIGVTTKGYKPVFNMTLTDGNNHSYSITDNDVQADSLAIRTGTSNTGELTIGAAIIGSLSVGLLNDGSNNNKYNNVNWRGAYIEATFTVNGANVQLGRYYVNEHSEQGGAIRVVAYDAMQILDGYQIYEHQFTYPLDAVTAVNTIKTALAQRTNRTWQVVGLNGVSLSLPDPGTDKMSERAFLSYVAQILCKYVVVKRMNGIDTIFFGWYDTAHPVRNAGTTFSHDLKTSDYNPENFQIKVYDSSYTVTVRGTGGTGPLTNAVYIENNPFIRSSNVGLPNPGGGMAYDIYTQVHALTYRPGTVDIVADIALEAGDVITVSTGPLGGTYTMMITNLTFGTGLTMSVSSDADPSDDMIFNPSTYFKKATQQAISDELADADSELSQALGGGGDDGTELITLPAVKVICWDANNPWFKYAGHKFRFTYPDPDPSHQGTGLYNFTQSIWCEAFGDDVVDMKQITYPEQTIRVPKTQGKWAWVDLLITKIETPNGTDYYRAGESEATRACPLLAYRDNPVKVRCVVERGADGRIQFHDYAPPGLQRYDRNVPQYRRPLIMYNGFTAGEFDFVGAQPISEYSSYDHDYTRRGFRFAVCEMPLPGYYFDTTTPDVAGHEETGGKWLYSTTSQGHTTWNPIPYYDSSDPSQPYFLNYYDGSRWENN